MTPLLWSIFTLGLLHSAVLIGLCLWLCYEVRRFVRAIPERITVEWYE